MDISRRDELLDRLNRVREKFMIGIIVKLNILRECKMLLELRIAH